MDDYKKEIDDYFCRFTFGQFVTILLLEIVTLFFVFYLGARYGTDLVGGGRDEGTHEAALPPESPKDVNDIVGAPKVDYTYPDVLTSRDGQKAIRIKPSGMTAEEYEQKKMTPPSVVEVPEQEKVELSPEPVKAPTPAKAVAIPEEPLTPPTEAIPPEKPQAKAAPPPAKTKEKYSIQVASFSTEEEALEAVSRWKGRGYSAFMTSAEIPDKGLWYRVRIGRFASRNEAQSFLTKFKAKEKVSALVVPSGS